MSATLDKLKAQISLMNTAIKRPFDADPAISDELVTRLASYLESKGTTSILNLTHFVDQASNMAFFYDRVTGYVYPPAFGFATYDSQTGSVLGPDVFTMLSRDDRFNYWVFLKFSQDGYPVFVTHFEDTGSDWQAAWKGALFVGSVLVSFAFPALGAQIGQAVMGAQAAAAYPAVASAIGNAAVNSVLNGGDVKTAVVGSVTGVASGGVGGAVATATDSAMIGSAAAAATRAAITGGDLKQAVAGSLLRSGFDALDTGAIFQQQEKPAMSDLFNADDQYGLYDFGGTGFGNAIPNDINGDGSLTFADVNAAGGLTFAENWDFSQPISYGSWTGTQAPTGATVASPGGVNLTDLALTGLKLVSAWNNAGNPAPRVGTQTSRVNSNGTLTQNINGRSTTAQMPIGTPYLAPNGSLITNNGDGTYTTVNTNGTVTTSRYGTTGSANLGAMLQNPYVLGGVALVAVLLLQKRRA